MYPFHMVTAKTLGLLYTTILRAHIKCLYIRVSVLMVMPHQRRDTGEEGRGEVGQAKRRQ